MPEPPWGLIENGATFEHLVQALLSRVDPKSVAFGRPGKDGGQDIRSGDGSLIYQCKYHQNARGSAALSDAKKEAEKIKKYREPGHPRFGQWKAAKRWCLVTNAMFNPADQAKWEETIEPLFRDLELRPERWGRDKLNSLLADNPDLVQYFFEGETRVFWSIGEAASRLETSDPFRPGVPLTPFQGRKIQLDAISNFLESEENFLLVHGQGAIGKTRLLLEAGLNAATDGKFKVLWAVTGEMSRSSKWFQGLIREREALLIIDDPESEEILKRLAEQISGSVPWKVLVAARSPHDPVVKYLQTSGIRERTKTLLLEKLQQSEASAVARSMIEAGNLGTLPSLAIGKAAEELAAHLERYPGWIAIAVRVLETQGSLASLPQNTEELAEKYLKEILEKQTISPSAALLQLLHWLALLGGLNREDESALDQIRQRSGIISPEDLLQNLADLVRRRVLIERGARGRIVEIKPDVMRDHILARWLTFNRGFGPEPCQASAAAIALAADAADQLTEGSTQRETMAVLQSLARTETNLTLSGRPAAILAKFFTRLADRVPHMSATRLRSMAEVLTEIGEYYPNPIIALSRALRNAPVADEQVDGILGRRTVGRRDVVLELAWMVFHAALGARERPDRLSVLRELYELSALELELGGEGLPNDGKRARKLLQRVVEGGPSFWTEFDDAAAILARDALRELSEDYPPARTETATAFLQAVTALERTQTWAPNSRSISIQRVAIGSTSPAGRLRSEVLDEIKAQLALPVLPIEKRIVYWRILGEAHGNANSLNIQQERTDPTLRDEITLDLQFALRTLPGRGFQELAAARPLWSWHAQFDKDPQLSAMATRLEELYSANTLAAEFEPLVGNEHWESHVANATQKARELAAQAATQPAALTEFLDRADAYLAAKQHPERPLTLAWHLGVLAPHQPAVADFIVTQLGDQGRSWRGDFVRVCAAGWMDALRLRGGEPTERRLELLLEACADDPGRAALVVRVYDRHSIRSAEPTSEEIRRVRCMAGLFLAVDRTERFAEILGETFDCEPTEFRSAAETMLRQLEGRALRDTVEALATAMASRAAAPGRAILPGTGEWLLNQLSLVPKLYEIRDTQRTYIETFLRHVGRPSLGWLADALEARALREQESAQQFSYLGNELLARFANPVSDRNQSDSTFAVARLVELARNRDAVGHDIPDVLRYVDPKGLLAPFAVAKLLKSIQDEGEFIWVGRCVRAFGFDSENWRTAARPVVERALPLSGKERSNYYPLLLWQRSGAFQMSLGQVPQHILEDADAARAARDRETEEAFKPFREWRLKAAEAELQQWRDRAQETTEV